MHLALTVTGESSVLDVLMKRAVLFGVSSRAADLGKLPFLENCAHTFQEYRNTALKASIEYLGPSL